MRRKLIRSVKRRKLLTSSQVSTPGWVGLLAVVIVLVVGVGGVLPEALVAATCVAVVTLLIVRQEPTRAHSARIWTLGVALACLLAWTWLQLIPMPLSLLALVSRQAAEVWGHARAPVADGFGWGMISLEPVGTLSSGVALATALGTLLIASTVGVTKEGRDRLTWLVIVAGLILSVLTLGHSAVGAKRVFGIYEPVRDTHQPLGPLINTNHLSAVVALALTLGLGKMLAARRDMVVLGLAVCCLLLATLVWLGSRGGMLGAAAGCVWLVITVRGRANRLRVGMIAIGGAATVATLSVVWPAGFSANASKVETVRESARALQISPLVGVGPGAFEAVFPRVRESTGHVLYTHPENIVIELMASSGYLVGGLFLLVALYALRPRISAPSSAAAHAGIVGVLVHDFGDFSLNTPLNAVLVAITAAIAFPPRWQRSESKLLPQRPLASVGWGTVVVAALALFSVRHDTLSRTRDSLHELAMDRGVSRQVARRQLARALVVHPAEAYIPFAGALRSSWEEPGALVSWASAVLNRAKVYGPVHVLVARHLRGVNPSQARLEYRLAMSQDPRLIRSVAGEAAGLVDSAEDARELLPPGEAGESALELIIQASQEPALVQELNGVLLALYPMAPGGLDRRARQLRDEFAAGKCEAACRDEVATIVARMKVARPGKCRSLEVALWFAQSMTSESLDEYERAAAKTEDSARCLVQVGIAALRAGDRERASTLANAAENRGCRNGPECVGLALELASLQIGLGRPADARLQLRRAADRTGRNEAILARWAQVSASLELHGEAANLYGELERRGGDGKKWRDFRVRETELSVERSTPP